MIKHSYISSVTPERFEEECINPEHVRPLLGRVIDQPAAEKVVRMFGLLADPTRARIIHALSIAPELCVCDIALLVEASQSAISHQLRLLRSEGAVLRRRAGRVIYYSLADGHFRHALSDAVEHALATDAREASA